MNIKNHTRNQKRMYRIHKQEEKIMEQELMIGSLKQKIDRLNNIINELEKDINENIKVNDGSIICGLSSNSERKECKVENEAYYNILNKLKELKEDNKNV